MGLYPFVMYMEMRLGRVFGTVEEHDARPFR
jgi:hypothetical protein